MDAGLVRFINGHVNAVLRDPVTSQRLMIAGLDPRPGSTPESTTAFVTAEVAKFCDIARRTELRLDR